jgi:flagellar FliL protein
MSKKTLILIVAGVVVLGGGGTAGFLLLRPAPAEVGEAPAEVGEEPTIVTMDTFLVNLTSSEGGDRFAKVDLQLTLTPPSAAAKVTEDVLLAAKLRDRVLTLLTSKAAEDLLTPVGKEGLRRELKATLNPMLPEGEIHEVLYANFVVQ